MTYRRWLRRIAYALGALLATVGAAWLVLQSEVGRGLIATVIERELSPYGIIASVDELGGWLPTSPRIGKLTLADENGIFMTIEDVRVSWRPLARIFGDIVIDDVWVGKVEWHR